MERGFAERFAKEWIAAWNSHDLERILAARTPLYARADAVIDTAGCSVEASFSALLAILPKGCCRRP